MDVPQYADGDNFRRRIRKSIWQDAVRGYIISQPLHGTGRKWNDCICIRFSGIGKAVYSRSWTGVYSAEECSTGLFGGEGFIMQRVSGNGVVFAEFDGHVVEYELQAGQQIVIDTGHLAAMSASCTMEIQTVPGLKNKLLGGEGLFNTVVSGPGNVWLQTMPISNVARAIQPFIQSSN